MLWKIAKVGREPAVELAANELARCLRLMYENAQVAILSYPDIAGDVTDVLWLRVSGELAEIVADPALDDGYAIHVSGTTGSICGTNSRSVLMGVYRFLKELGCRWIRPGADGEVIPRRRNEAIHVALTEMAAKRHRGICIEGAVSYENVADMIDWMPKVGLNAYFNQFLNPAVFYNRWYSHQKNPLLEGEALTSAQIEGIRNRTVEEMKQRGLLYHYAGHGWTCTPLGIQGESWDPKQYDIPNSFRKYVAKVNGCRNVWKGVALNTNLCYSKPAARRKMADAVVQHCLQQPEIDVVHVWLSDGSNNHCECESCKKMRPSDWYVTILNEIDEKLTKKHLNTKVVFLLYQDLLWEPTQTKLKNPDRFLIMFAPISRTYSVSYKEAKPFDEGNLPKFQLNQLKFPGSVEENLAWLRRWKRVTPCDGFLFDYHYMWDHFYDPGYYKMAQILFDDMCSLHSIGLNGMVSCQNQRVFFPNGFGMTAMAEALWNQNADFDEIVTDYYRTAYGPAGDMVKEYMMSLSNSFDPAYIRSNKDIVCAEKANNLKAVGKIVADFEPIIEKCSVDETLQNSQRCSWEYLTYHAVYCRLLAKALQKRAEGDFAAAKILRQEVVDYVRSNELRLQRVLDVYEFQVTVVDRLIWEL